MGKKREKRRSAEFLSESHPSVPTKRKRIYYLFLPIIRPLPGAPGPLFDTRHDRAAESADSSLVPSTVLAAKKTLWFLVIPSAAGSNVKDVSVMEEASGVSDARESPASVVQYNVYCTVSPSIVTPFEYFVTGSQKICHVISDGVFEALVIPRFAGAIGFPEGSVGGSGGGRREL